MRHNSVFICGRVIETSEIGCRVELLRGKRNFGGEKYKKDIIDIMTANPEIFTDKIKENDIVMAKGTLKSMPMKTFTVCSHCKAENIQTATTLFIDPFYTEKRASFDSKKEADKAMSDWREISNQITIGGNLLTPPQNYTDKNGVNTTSYNINNRDNMYSVKSYGQNAKNDAFALNKGSFVFVDGFLANKKGKHTSTCSCCGKQYNWSSPTLEIISYTTEYI